MILSSYIVSKCHVVVCFIKRISASQASYIEFDGQLNKVANLVKVLKVLQHHVRFHLIPLISS